VPRPSSRSSESEGDLGLTTLLGDGDALVVGRGRAMESATSGPCDATIVAEQVPAREPVVVSSHLQFTVVDSAPTQVVTSATTLLGQRAQIPTLVSSGPGAQAGLSDWPPCASGFGNVKSTVYNYYDGDDHDMYWDENIDPYDTRNVTSRPMYGDKREFCAFHAPVPSTAMPHVIGKSRTFRPLDRGHGRMSRDSSCSRDSMPKSRGSSRATSRASAANSDWVGDFMKKFADDASSRERRLVEEAWQREKDLRDMAVEREKEIRADMKQLAASEARVAALEQQLQDQAQLQNPRCNVLSRRESKLIFLISQPSHRLGLGVLHR